MNYYKRNNEFLMQYASAAGQFFLKSWLLPNINAWKSKEYKLQSIVAFLAELQSVVLQ